MKERLSGIIFALVALVIMAIGPKANAESVKPVVLANTCFSCHGTNGKSVGAMPSIAGKSPKYISSILKSFRSGKREATVMNRIAKGFSDSEIDTLANYFSGK